MIKFGSGFKSVVHLGFHSGKQLSNVRVYPTVVDRILEAMALFFWILLAISTVYVGLHTSAPGVQSKAWIMGGMGMAVMALMAYTAYMPIHKYSFPFKITEQNVVAQFQLATRITRAMNVIVGGMLLCGVWLEAESLLGLPDGFFVVGMNVSATLMVVALLVYYFFAYRYR